MYLRCSLICFSVLLRILRFFTIAIIIVFLFYELVLITRSDEELYECLLQKTSLSFSHFLFDCLQRIDSNRLRVPYFFIRFLTVREINIDSLNLKY